MPDTDPYDGPAVLAPERDATPEEEAILGAASASPTVKRAPRQRREQPVVAVDPDAVDPSEPEPGDLPPAYSPPEAVVAKRERATWAREDALAEERDNAVAMFQESAEQVRELTQRLAVWEGNANQALVNMHNRHNVVLDSMRVELARMALAMGVTLQHIGIAAAPDAPAVADVDTGGLT
jgi:hypothetical protein